MDLVIYDFEPGVLDDVPATEISFEPLELEQMVYLAGMGTHAHFNDPELVWDFARRSVRAPIRRFGWVTRGDEFLIADYEYNRLSSGFFVDGGSASTGDSGGGTFVEMNDESFGLAAINIAIYGGIGSATSTRGGQTASLILSDPEVRLFLDPILEPDPDPLEDDGDRDGDGYTNLYEFAFGSDPRDPESKPIVITRIENNQLIANYLSPLGGKVDGWFYIAAGYWQWGEVSTTGMETWAFATACTPSKNLPAPPQGYVWSANCYRMVAPSATIRLLVDRRRQP